MTQAIEGKSAKSKPGYPRFGTEFLPDGQLRFNLWAPSASSIELCLYDKNVEKKFQMLPATNGWFKLETKLASVGHKYCFVIDGDLKVPDPASRYQPDDVHGPSLIVNPETYKLRKQWRGRPWEEVVLYELHVGTFTEEGTFAGLVEKLDYLRELGITAIELLPIADFPGKYNWGYDGVLLYAPDSSYGTPADLIRLINEAHDRDLMVFIDLVYNHFGPDGNYLYCYAKKFFNEKHHTPWGAAINFDGPDNEVVRRFYVENALYWLEEFGFDGIRFDAVHAIADTSQNHILHDIAKAVKTGPGRERHIHLVLENDDNSSRYLVRNGDGKEPLYSAQWNDDFHHAAHVIVTGEDVGYYSDFSTAGSGRSPVQHLARCLSEGFSYQGDESNYRAGLVRGELSKNLPPTAFVSFTQNHDQVGNRAFGERLSEVCVSEPSLQAITAVFLLAPQIPMLFMGQEFESESPFYFFCDMHADLGKAITAGRRSEFARFPEFEDPVRREMIPDPIAFESFEKSKLVWMELHNKTEIFEFHRRLLELRFEHVVPLLRDGAQCSSQIVEADAKQVCVIWEFAAAQLCLIANLSSEAVPLSSKTESFISGLGDSSIFFKYPWHSEGEAGEPPALPGGASNSPASSGKSGGPGASESKFESVAELIGESGKNFVLEPWSLIWCKSNGK